MEQHQPSAVPRVGHHRLEGPLNGLLVAADRAAYAAEHDLQYDRIRDRVAVSVDTNVGADAMALDHAFEIASRYGSLLTGSVPVDGLAGLAGDERVRWISPSVPMALSGQPHWHVHVAHTGGARMGSPLEQFARAHEQGEWAEVIRERPWLQVTDGRLRVRIMAQPGRTAEMPAAVAAVGGQVEVVYRGGLLAEAHVPVAALRALAEQPAVGRVDLAGTVIEL